MREIKQRGAGFCQKCSVWSTKGTGVFDFLFAESSVLGLLHHTPSLCSPSLWKLMYIPRLFKFIQVLLTLYCLIEREQRERERLKMFTEKVQNKANAMWTEITDWF